ncbi:efflux RND transporter periplasmic adaptor subunit [Patescibacteria group bacterium]|nr:efflux RND transporter periplasmic adaptor subunit [Patescibacteria group bacterium]
MKKIKKLFTGKRIIIAIVVIVVVWIGYGLVNKNGEPEYILEKVSYGTVVKEVSETGMVKISEEANLGFKNSGKITEIYVKVGDEVTAGQSLVKLDTSQLYIELSEAQAALDVAQADYNNMLAGSSAEEIKIAETDLVNAQLTLDNYKQTLINVETDAQEDLNQAYEGALNKLDDAHLDVYNALIAVNTLKTKYFGGNDQGGITIRNSISIIESSLSQIETYLNEAKLNSDPVKIDLAISKTKESLSSTRVALADVRSVMESGSYAVTATDKTIIDNQRTYVNSAYEDIVGVQQGISSMKITNTTNISDAEANVASAEVALQKKQDELALKKAGPTTEAINLYLAKINQAKARVSLLNNRLSEATLKSPTDGQIIKINKRKGETAQATDSVIGFLPSGPFQVEVDIYEEDIVDIRVDNLVEISLPAFPNNVFMGKVISVDPAEKLIGGVVYYEVNISFEDNNQNIKPGMTADIVIQTDKKENVLVVPQEATEKRNGIRMVKVYTDKSLVYMEIKMGLEGEDYIEIISGLEEGAMVIIGENKNE